MSTLENWVPIMHAGMDATRPGLPPQRDASPQNALYFVLFIIVGSFVVLNLFVGVVIDTFQRISDETMGGAFMDSRQRAWVSANQIMLQLRPHKRKARPDSSLRRAAYAVVESAYFDGAIMLVILLNIVAMTLTYYGEPQQHTNTLAALNLCFSAIFAAEAAVKLLAYFPRQYLEDRWNRFDGLLVLGSIVDVAMQMAEGSAGEGSAAGAPQLLRSLHLPASPRISPHLPTSPRISAHLPSGLLRPDPSDRGLWEVRLGRDDHRDGPLLRAVRPQRAAAQHGAARRPVRRHRHHGALRHVGAQPRRPPVRHPRGRRPDANVRSRLRRASGVGHHQRAQLVARCAGAAERQLVERLASSLSKRSASLPGLSGGSGRSYRPQSNKARKFPHLQLAGAPSGACASIASTASATGGRPRTPPSARRGGFTARCGGTWCGTAMG